LTFLFTGRKKSVFLYTFVTDLLIRFYKNCVRQELIDRANIC
jgi:hypothetical protein